MMRSLDFESLHTSGTSRPATKRPCAVASRSYGLTLGLPQVWMVLGLIASRLPAAVLPPSVSVLPPVSEAFECPTRVASARDGRVFVVDSLAGRVVVLDAFDRFVNEKTGLQEPLGIDVDLAGNIYLGEAGSGSVSVFDAQWEFLSKLGAGDGEFGIPGYIAIDSGTTPPTVYVSDSGVNQLRVYRGGTLAGLLGGESSVYGHLTAPRGVWVSEAGNVYVVNQDYEGVFVFDRGGTLLRAFKIAPDGYGLVGRQQGIVGDAQGRLYLADTFQDRVNVFDAQGTLLSTLGGYGRGAGQLRSPAGVTLDALGRLHVASINSARVEIYGLDCFLQMAATPAQEEVMPGATVTLSVTPGCAAPFTVQWRRDTSDLVDGGVVSGATNLVLTLTGVTFADNGLYSAVLTSPGETRITPGYLLTLPAPPRSVLAAEMGVDSLRLTWDNNVAWRLQVQANAPGAGLSTNWVDISGSAETNAMSFPIDPAKGSVFYRLVFP